MAGEASLGPSTYEEAVRGAGDLVSTWDALASSLGEPTRNESPCAHEAREIQDAIENPQQFTRAIAGDAVSYVAAATQHLRALIALLGPDIVLSGWSLTRTLVEYCGRAAWLMGPAVTPRERAARFYMERIVSIHMARLSAERIGQRSFAKELRKSREGTLDEARRLFPDIKLFTAEDFSSWSVGGEPYASLGGAVNEFARSNLEASGLYDTLSSFTHPSLYRLRTQTRVTALGDKTHRAYMAEPELVQWQFQIASLSIYRTAHHIVGYLGLPEGPLESWADRHSSLLVSPGKDQ